jgi:hypothetical protein
MKCYECGGRMEKVHKDIEADWKGPYSDRSWS